MLVIDHVVLQAAQHASQVVHLEHEHAVVGKELGHSPRDVIDLRDVSVDVVRHHEVGRTVLAADSRRQLAAEEIVDDGDPRVGDGLHDVARRVHADRLAHALVGER